MTIISAKKQRKGGSGYTNVKGVKKQQQKMEKEEWGGYSYDIKEPPSPIISPPKPKPKPKSKAVDEDLYKIPPEYLHVKPKRVFSFSFLFFISIFALFYRLLLFLRLFIFRKIILRNSSLISYK